MVNGVGGDDGEDNDENENDDDNQATNLLRALSEL